MLSLIHKEIFHLLGSLTGYLAIIVYLVFSWLYMFVFSQTNVLDNGYASLSAYLELSPWVFMFLIPALSMRLFSEELRLGTMELLATLPFSRYEIVMSKYVAGQLLATLCIVCSLPYLLTIGVLSRSGGFDIGATSSGYLGLLMVSMSFGAISIWASILTRQAVVAFLLGSLFCFLFFFGFDLFSQIPSIEGTGDYYLELWGIKSHFANISRGVLDLRDIIYFFSIIIFFLLASIFRLQRILS